MKKAPTYTERLEALVKFLAAHRAEGSFQVSFHALYGDDDDFDATVGVEIDTLATLARKRRERRAATKAGAA